MAHHAPTGTPAGHRPATPVRWIGLLLLAFGLILTGGWLGTPHTQAQTPAPVWAQIDAGLPDTYTLNSVFMVNGANAAWIAASDTLYGHAILLTRQGDHWTSAVGPGFRAPLHAIVAVSDDHIWAVGERGLIIEGRQDKYWFEVPSPLPNANLYALQMFGNGEEGWAGGIDNGQAVMLHYKDGAWRVDPTLTGPGIVTSLHFTDGAGWAAGSLGSNPAIWRYTQSGWVADPLPACPSPSSGCRVVPLGVRALSPSEAWVVGYQDYGGSRSAVPQAAAYELTGGQWQIVAPWLGVLDDPWANIRQKSALNGVSFTPDNYGLAVGWQGDQFSAPGLPYIVSYRPSDAWTWHYEPVPYIPGGILHAVSQADSTHALAVGERGVILGYGYGGLPPASWPVPTPAPGGTPLPTYRVPDPQIPGVLYFPETGHSLQGGFRAYWEAHGSLTQFGYPLTEEFAEQDPATGRYYTVQYFERNRFEWHPENRPPYDVQLGLLGRTVTAGREQEPPFQPLTGPPLGTRYFAATDHTLAPEFAAYWDDHGELPVYGYSISEPFTETSPTDGHPYLVQYFERNRLEYLPELPAPFRVSLGLLGSEVLRRRGWLP